MYYNDKIRMILETEMVDYVGFADLSGYSDDLARFGGKIVTGFRNGISIGIRLPDTIVDLLPDRVDPNVACEYKTHAYGIINQRLDIAASKVASFLNREKHRTLPISSAERTDPENAIPTVSHKMIAHIAGLGWIGKSCLLVTPEDGPRVRFITVLTDAPLEARNEPMPQRCGDCRTCVDICPVGAIRGRNYQAGEPREERLDFRKCQEYFDSQKISMKWDVCGLCLYACPHGRTG